MGAKCRRRERRCNYKRVCDVYVKGTKRVCDVYVKGTIEMATLVTKASMSLKYFTKQKDLSITLKLWAKALFGPWHEAYSRKNLAASFSIGFAYASFAYVAHFPMSV